MQWDQIIGVLATVLTSGAAGAFVATLRKSGSEAKAADLDRMTKTLDEVREENGRIGGRVLVLEDQYRKLWDQHVALQQSHAALQSEHVVLLADRERGQRREAELEAEVSTLKARVAELERANQPPNRAGDA